MEYLDIPRNNSWFTKIQIKIVMTTNAHFLKYYLFNEIKVKFE
jgi:hypothetical protein